MARLRAAGHEEVARALGRGLEEGRGLDLGEVAPVQRLADSKGEVVAQLEVGGHLGTAQIQVAVAQAHVFARVHAVLDLEGRRLRGVEHLDLGHEHLDLTGLDAGVLHALGTLAHRAGHHDRPLQAHALRGVEGRAARVLGVKGDLRHALAVAQIDEDQAAMVTPVPHPAGQGHGLADIIISQLSTGMSVQGVTIGHTFPIPSQSQWRASLRHPGTS